MSKIKEENINRKSKKEIDKLTAISGNGKRMVCKYFGNNQFLFLKDEDDNCKSEYILKNEKQKFVCALQTDTGSKSNCDYVVINISDNEIYFIELKSQLDNDILKKAKNQIIKTREYFNDNFKTKCTYKHYARVVYSNPYPDFPLDDEIKKVISFFRKKGVQFSGLNSPIIDEIKHIEII